MQHETKTEKKKARRAAAKSSHQECQPSRSLTLRTGQLFGSVVGCTNENIPTSTLNL